jgi:hypothetical protein
VNQIGEVIAALMQIPGVGEFLKAFEQHLLERAETAALTVISDTLHRKDRDPEFAAKFMELSSQLASQTTEEGKREVLKQMQSLRSTR